LRRGSIPPDPAPVNTPFSGLFGALDSRFPRRLRQTTLIIPQTARQETRWPMQERGKAVNGLSVGLPGRALWSRSTGFPACHRACPPDPSTMAISSSLRL